MDLGCCWRLTSVLCKISPEFPFYLRLDQSAEVFCNNRIIYFQNTAEQRGGRFRLDRLDAVYSACKHVCVHAHVCAYGNHQVCICTRSFMYTEYIYDVT